MASKGAPRCFENEEYLLLDNLQLSLTRDNSHEDGTFTLCFWMYLLKGSKAGLVICQSNARTQATLPFLTIDPELRLALHPLPSSSSCVLVSEQSCPLDKWVHLGCEVGHTIARLHMDGIIAGEKAIQYPEEDMRPLILSGGEGSHGPVQAYVHHICALSQPSVTNHFVKNPPLELSLDGSTGGTDDQEVEEGGDGIWSVVGGKASCRRNFALDVVLLDALGRSVHKDLELVASLVYADTGVLVEKPKDDAEAPLLTTFDGVEFPSTERPIKLVHGRASFKLKISQLSSKCDNRLFRVCFESPSAPKFPFLRVLSRPIRCVSRNRNSRTPAGSWKRSIGVVYPAEAPCSPGRDDKAEVPRISDSNGTFKYTAKIQRAGDTRFQTPMDFRTSPTVAPALSGHPAAAAAAHIPAGPWPPPPLSKLLSNAAELGKNYSSKLSSQMIFPDYLVFKYCLETIPSRSAFLRGIACTKSEDELNELAVRVSQCTGCHHNGYQILIARSLLQSCEDAWKQLSTEGSSVSWSNLLSTVEESFQQISGRTKRSFSQKDGEFLQGVCGCGDTTTREQFDRLWHWIYPVAMTVASPQVRKAWENEEPRWIQGMVSRKEAEEMLKAADGLPTPGTFVLRFTTRIWPHPDAGALVVTYVGPDLRINHRLLNIDNRASSNEEDDHGMKTLSELLLSQPELDRPVSVQK